MSELEHVSKNMIFVQGGAFNMGSEEYYKNEKPVHEVTLTGSFYIGKYPVTQKEWKKVMGSNPSYFKGNNQPVESVSWYDAVEFCNKKSEMEGLEKCYSGSGKNIKCDFSKNGYRLPTEAEWEYAARGGIESCNSNYRFAGSNNIDEVAWYDDNSGTHPVGKKKPNELGIYDMSGNVLEWCHDWYDSDYYEDSPEDNPTVPNSGSFRVLRGGFWGFGADNCRVADRGGSGPGGSGRGIGFRLLRANLD